MENKSGGVSFQGVSETSFQVQRGIQKRDRDRELYRARQNDRRSKSSQWAHTRSNPDDED